MTNWVCVVCVISHLNYFHHLYPSLLTILMLNHFLNAFYFNLNNYTYIVIELITFVIIPPLCWELHTLTKKHPIFLFPRKWAVHRAHQKKTRMLKPDASWPRWGSRWARWTTRESWILFRHTRSRTTSRFCRPRLLSSWWMPTHMSSSVASWSFFVWDNGTSWLIRAVAFNRLDILCRLIEEIIIENNL